jgi:hypothetical protein
MHDAATSAFPFHEKGVINRDVGITGTQLAGARQRPTIHGFSESVCVAQAMQDGGCYRIK